MIYGVGSALTALSWSVPTLALGWSILEGIGAALVLPAMVALIGRELRGQGTRGRLRGPGRGRRRGHRSRPDPRRLGDDQLSGASSSPVRSSSSSRSSWAPACSRSRRRSGQTGGLDWVGSVLSASGLALIVFGVLQSSNWGWLQPPKLADRAARVLAVPFVIAGGGVLAGFRAGSAGARGTGGRRW